MVTDAGHRVEAPDLLGLQYGTYELLERAGALFQHPEQTVCVGAGALYAVDEWSDGRLVLSHVNFFGNTTDEMAWGDVTSVVGGRSVDPLYVDVSGADPRDWDLSLQASSPVVDVGAPLLDDDDGTAGDLGAYGGPGGGDW